MSCCKHQKLYPLLGAAGVISFYFRHRLSFFPDESRRTSRFSFSKYSQRLGGRVTELLLTFLGSTLNFIKTLSMKLGLFFAYADLGHEADYYFPTVDRTEPLGYKKLRSEAISDLVL